MVVGVLIGGVGSKLYRTTDTYHKSSDLIIEILLIELERFISIHNKPPSIFYVDHDGGSENTNVTVLHMEELLVAKGLVDTLIDTR